MAKCFDVVGYVEPCNTIRQKYTGRALLIKGDSLPIEFSENGLLINKINEKTSFKELYNGIQSVQTVKMLPITIDAENPFGVTVQGNIDSGRAMYTKTIPVSVISIAGISEPFIMGLQKGIKVSQVILVLERNADSIGVSSSDVFGAYSPIRLDPTSVTRSEYENGGAWNFNLVCDEPVPNVNCDMTDLSATLDALNA